MRTEAKLHKGYWVLTAPPHVAMRLKRLFGRLAKGRTELKLRDTPEVCRELDWFSQRYPMQFTPHDHLRVRSKQQQHVEAEVEALVSGTVSTRAFDLAVPPRDYQKLAAELLLRRRSLLLADDLGVGKTAAAICAMAQAEVRPVLVVCPTHLPEQWRREIERFCPGLHIHILKAAQPYDLTPKGRPGQARLFEGFPDVIISNYHKLAGWADALAGRIRFVIFDEAQELRGGAVKKVSQKYEAAKSIADASQWRMGLTATPIYNYGIEFWSVLSVIAPNELGEKTEFVTEWCTGGEDGKAKIKDPRAFGTYLRQSGIMLRRTRSDVGRELPEATRDLHYIEADLEALNKVEKSAADLARMILSSAGTGGFQKMRAAEEFNMLLRQATGIAKAPYVAKFVRMLVESGEPVVLFGWHREVYRIWSSELSDLGVAFYTGSESPTQKAESVRAFTEKRAKVLIVSLRAGAGLDGLQHVCRTGVFGELDWSPGAMDQCGGRIHRDGQKEPVMLYVLVSDSGADPIMVDVLGLKRGQVDKVRDPDAPLVEQLEIGGDHVKRLAESYLEQVTRRVA